MAPFKSNAIELIELVCLLFGSIRIKNINDLWHNPYQKKLESKEKVCDLSLLPPCSDNLQLYIFRSAYIARRWRLSKENIIDEPNRKYHGWNEDGQIHWVKRHFRVTSKRYLLKRWIRWIFRILRTKIKQFKECLILWYDMLENFVIWVFCLILTHVLLILTVYEWFLSSVGLV